MQLYPQSLLITPWIPACAGMTGNRPDYRIRWEYGKTRLPRLRLRRMARNDGKKRETGTDCFADARNDRREKETDCFAEFTLSAA
jgi:hypothetical protein